MPNIFDETTKAQQRNVLLEQGFALIMKQGYKHTTVDQLVAIIDTSKGYFYSLYESKEEFLLSAIRHQMEQNYRTLEESVANSTDPRAIQQAYQDIYQHMTFVTHEDIMYVSQKISSRQWEQFREFEREYFTRVITLLTGGTSSADPEIISNLSALIFLSANTSVEYLFLDKMHATIGLLLETLHRYTYSA